MLTSEVVLAELGHNERTDHQGLVDLVRRIAPIDQLVLSGMRVFLKPTLSGADSSEESTSLELIAAVGQIVRNCGGKVIIGDSPGMDGQNVEEAWARHGLARLASDKQFQLINLEKSGVKPIAMDTRVYYLSQEVLSADLVINLPKLRPIGCAGFKGAVANLLGILPGFQKYKLCDGNPLSLSYAKTVVDLYSLVTPELHIMEADVKSSADYGPDRRHLLVSIDGLAVDRLAAELVECDPDSNHVLRLAREAGLGIGFAEGISLRGQKIDRRKPRHVVTTMIPTIKGRFKQLVAPFLTMMPDIQRSLCDGCGICALNCPTQAITQPFDLPEFRSELCITCWRCQQSCPGEAISVSKSWAASRLTA